MLGDISKAKYIYIVVDITIMGKVIDGLSTIV